MRVEILCEAGYEQAKLALALSYDRAPSAMPPVMQRLAGRGHGHDKFLRCIILWLDITGTRHWWQEFATYKVGVDDGQGAENSESTIHTLTRRPLRQSDFNRPILPAALDDLNAKISAGADLMDIKDNLPEGFLQRRIVTLSYAALRNILEQRGTHRNKDWHEFYLSVKAQAAHPELLFDAE